MTDQRPPAPMYWPAGPGSIPGGPTAGDVWPACRAVWSPGSPVALHDGLPPADVFPVGGCWVATDTRDASSRTTACRSRRLEHHRTTGRHVGRRLVLRHPDHDVRTAA